MTAKKSVESGNYEYRLIDHQKALHQHWSSKQLSAVDITEYYLSAIEAANPQLNAWTTITALRARQHAEKLDKTEMRVTFVEHWPPSLMPSKPF